MEKYIKALTNIGLTELEAKVYINMLKKQYFTATEIATISKINRTQTYDILSKLINRGMCSEIRGKVRKYSAIDPEKVFTNFVDFNYCHLWDNFLRDCRGIQNYSNYKQ